MSSAKAWSFSINLPVMGKKIAKRTRAEVSPSPSLEHVQSPFQPKLVYRGRGTEGNAKHPLQIFLLKEIV
jgi:hypothetical protein